MDGATAAEVRIRSSAGPWQGCESVQHCQLQYNEGAGVQACSPQGNWQEPHAATATGAGMKTRIRFIHTEVTLATAGRNCCRISIVGRFECAADDEVDVHVHYD